MAAERTCRSIWLIVFTLPGEAGLSWGYLHLSHLSFVQFNSSSYYLSNHLFLYLHMYPSGLAHTVHTKLAHVASWHFIWWACLHGKKNTLFLRKCATKKVGNYKKATSFKTNRLMLVKPADLSVHVSVVWTLLWCFLKKINMHFYTQKKVTYLMLLTF